MADVVAISVYVRRAAGPDGVRAVVDYAAERGFRITAVPSRHCVLLRGSPAALAAAFAPIPPQLAMQIEAMLGLETGVSDLAPAIATQTGSGDTLAALAAALGLPDGDGAGHCIGLLGVRGGIVDKDTLAAACAALGIAAPATAPHVISIDSASPVPAAADDPLLPMLVVLAALVPKAKIVIYLTPQTPRGWIDALSAALDDRDNRPSVLCSGWAQPDQTPIGLTLAQHAAALGIHLCMATADPGKHRIASPTAGKVWTGSAIDAAIEAATQLRKSAPVAAAPSPQPPPPRPHFDAVTTSAKPGAAPHQAMVAFETDRYPGPRADGGISLPWALIPGSMALDIAAGGDALWALSALPAPRGYALFQWTPAGWRAASAGGTALAVDGHGLPWLVDGFGTLTQFTGTDWRVVRTGIHDVAVTAQGAVWALSATGSDAGRAVLHRPAPTEAHPAPEWIEDAMHAERISVAPDGTPWIVTRAGEAMRRDGDAWVIEATNVHDIAVDAHGTLWVASRTARRLYCRADPREGWLRDDGVADRVVAQPGGMLWAITPHGAVAVAKLAGQPDGSPA